jgi:VanZ family protein
MRLYPVIERTAFAVTLFAVLVLALLPVARLKEFGINIGFHYDKLNHGIAFGALVFFGSLGWPQRKARLMILLILFGAVIEVLQGTSLIRRDLDVVDWIADCVGIACGFIVTGCIGRVVRWAT